MAVVLLFFLGVACCIPRYRTTRLKILLKFYYQSVAGSIYFLLLLLCFAETVTSIGLLAVGRTHASDTRDIETLSWLLVHTHPPTLQLLLARPQAHSKHDAARVVWRPTLAIESMLCWLSI